MAREQGYRNTTFITPWSSLSSYVEARRPGYDTGQCIIQPINILFFRKLKSTSFRFGDDRNRKNEFSCETSFSISNFSISCRIATDSIQRSVDGSPSSV